MLLCSPLMHARRIDEAALDVVAVVNHSMLSPCDKVWRSMLSSLSSCRTRHAIGFRFTTWMATWTGRCVSLHRQPCDRRHWHWGITQEAFVFVQCKAMWKRTEPWCEMRLLGVVATIRKSTFLSLVSKKPKQRVSLEQWSFSLAAHRSDRHMDAERRQEATKDFRLL